jgi:hypothetical protein
LLFAYRVRWKVDQRKLMKTRMAVLKFQLRHFVNVHLWHYAFPATAAFIVKVSSDVLKKLRGCTFQYPVYDIGDETIVCRWNRILDELRTESTAYEDTRARR